MAQPRAESEGVPLDKVRIRGFRSIRDQEVSLGALNVLIGANGAGKSNFVGVFRLLNAIVEGRLQAFLGRSGGAEALLHFGSKTTDELELRFEFGQNSYRCLLRPTTADRLIFDSEAVYFQGPDYKEPFESFLGAGHEESRLREARSQGTKKTISHYVKEAFESWKIYHFHDTSESARMRLTGDLHDNIFFRGDASNLAAFLYRLQETDEGRFRNITDTIKMVAPFFDGFRLRPDRLNVEKIRLEWRERGSDAYFGASALSDGTLRFIALATLLFQPTPPTTILLDEPELGLHPAAISLLVAMLRSMATRTQIIVSTQSVTLVNQLCPEEIVVVDRRDSASEFRRLTTVEIESWLDDYALGELWEKNLLGGRPGA